VNNENDINHTTEKLREVQAEFVNPFLSALGYTLKTMGRASANKGMIALERANTFRGDAQILLRVDGTIKGFVILEMPETLARKFVSLFLFGLPIKELDAMARNSLEEFSIRVSERARRQLIDRGYLASVSSFVNFKKPLHFSGDKQFIVVPIDTEHGDFKVFFNVMKAELMEQAAAN
jgi:CheY-specific phosphatase CheX